MRPESCELIGPGGPTRLEPRTIQVLQHLARHAGEVCAREDVVSEVWAGAFVGEEALSHCVWELRQALGDDSRQPRFIQTVHRKGYKLIAPVSWLDTEPAVGGRYRLGEKIGTGTMGVVYAARDQRLDRPVALKFLPPELSRLSDAKERFLREARLAAALDHSNLCALYEVEETEDGQLFMVMPHYEGETLKQRLRRGPLAWTEAMDVARQLARGLAAAHAAGIIHRDVKPSNVFLTAGGQAKLLDFGVAKLVDATHHSRHGSSHGTPAYMSPEQTRGQRVDLRTDLWSLGAVLYETLAGVRPFPGEHDSTVIYGIQNATPEPLAARCPDTPQSIVRLVEALLSKEPGDRPANAASVLAALDEPEPTETAVGSAPEAASGGPPHREEGLRLLRERVERFWIDQALAESLGGAPQHQLTLEPRPEAVAHPWGKLRPVQDDRPAVPHDESLTTTFRRFGRALLILGRAGSGKSVTLLSLAQQAIELHRLDAAEPVPVVLRLASWADRTPPFESWLEDEISRRYYLPRSQARVWIRDGALMLVLDGLDEVAAPRLARCVAAINRFRETMPLVPLAITCRTEDYQNLAREGVRLVLAGAVSIEPLSAAQVTAALAEAPELRERLTQDRTLGELARSPLILAILRRIGPEDLVPEGEELLAAEGEIGSPPIPARRLDRLLYRYVRSCLRGPGRAFPPYPERQTVGWLTSLARSMVRHHRTLFQLEELQPSWLQAGWRRQAYVFLSRIAIALLLALVIVSMARFARDSTPVLSILWRAAAAGTMIACLDLTLLARRAAGPERGKAWSYPLLVAAVAAGTAVGLQLLTGQTEAPIGGIFFAMCLALVVRRRLGELRWSTDVAAVEALRWSWRGALRGLLASTVFLWILTTIVCAARSGLAHPNDIFRFLPNAVIAGSIVSLLIGLRRGLVDVKTRPNHGIWLTARNAALGAGLLFAGTLVGLSVARFLVMRDLFATTCLVDGAAILQDVSLIWSLSAGLALLGAIGLGGVDLIKHFVLRALLWTEGTAPARYTRFLDFATRCALLQRAGGGYVFIHHSLQEYFASLGSDTGN